MWFAFFRRIPNLNHPQWFTAQGRIQKQTTQSKLSNKMKTNVHNRVFGLSSVSFLEYHFYASINLIRIHARTHIHSQITQRESERNTKAVHNTRLTILLIRSMALLHLLIPKLDAYKRTNILRQYQLN